MTETRGLETLCGPYRVRMYGKLIREGDRGVTGSQNALYKCKLTHGFYTDTGNDLLNVFFTGLFSLSLGEKTRTKTITIFVPTM